MKRGRILYCLCRWLATGLLAVGVSSPARGAPVSFGIKVSFDNYTQNEPLTNFPVLVVLSNHMAGTGFNYDGFLSPNGYDLRFWTNRWRVGTQLNYEIESWNAAGLSHVWVQVPTLTNHTTIWASWGDKTNAAQLACTTNGAVWSEGYRQVYHLAGTNVQDSTANRLNGYATNSAVTVEAGIVGSGLSFDRDNYGAVSLPVYDRDAPPFTLSGWFKAGVSNGIIIGWVFYSPQDHLMMYINNDGKLGYWANAYMSTSVLLSPDSATNNQWRFGAVTRASDNFTRLYIDGREVNSGTMSVGPRDSFASCWLGRTTERVDTYPYESYYEGMMDEVRVSDVVRSSNWIWACWMNVASNTVFNMYSGYAARPGLVITVR